MQNEVKKYLILTSVGNAVKASISEIKQEEDALVTVFPFNADIRRKFFEYFLDHPDVLDPFNISLFVKNMKIFIKEFGFADDWLYNYLQCEFQMGRDLNSNRAVQWISSMKNFNMDNEVRRNTKMRIVKELLYVQNFLSDVNTRYTTGILSGDKRVLEKEAEKIKATAKTSRIEVISSIDMGNTLMPSISLVLGKVYDANVMMSSQQNEEKRKSYYLHFGVYTWLRDVCLTSHKIEPINTVKGISGNTIDSILLEGKLPLPILSGLSNRQIAEKVIKGEISRTNLSETQLAGIESYLKNKTIIEKKVESLYENLYNAIKTTALKCGVILPSLEDVLAELRKPSSIKIEEIAQPVSNEELKVEAMEKQNSLSSGTMERQESLSMPELSEQTSEEPSTSSNMIDKKKKKKTAMPSKGISGMMNARMPSTVSNIPVSITSTKNKPVVKEEKVEEFNKKDDKTWREYLQDLNESVTKLLGEVSPANLKAVSKAIKNAFLTRDDFGKNKHIDELSLKDEEELKKAESGNMKTTHLRLDTWQEKFVLKIREGKSIINIAPTSSGKTFVSMFALNDLLRKINSDATLAYVAPNFYQAFQAYTNLVRTFPKESFGLITERITINPPQCRFWVGTPEHLWIFAKATSKTFTTAIIDEIHTISFGQDYLSKISAASNISNTISCTSSSTRGSTSPTSYSSSSSSSSSSSTNSARSSSSDSSKSEIDKEKEDQFSEFERFQQELKNEASLKRIAFMIERAVLIISKNEEIARLSKRKFDLASFGLKQCSEDTDEFSLLFLAEWKKDVRIHKANENMAKQGVTDVINWSSKDLLELKKYLNLQREFEERKLFESSKKPNISASSNSTEIKMEESIVRVYEKSDSERRAEALIKICTLVKTQLIGLSGTIHEEDKSKLANFVETIMKRGGNLDKDMYKDKEFKVEYELDVATPKRPIELTDMVFTGDDIVNVKEIEGVKQKTIQLEPENTFKLLKLLMNKKMTPALIFDLNEQTSYTLFGLLIKYLREQHDTDYVGWRRIAAKFNVEIDTFNVEAARAREEKENLDQTERTPDDREGRTTKKANPDQGKIRVNYDSYLKRRIAILEKIIKFIIEELREKLGLEYLSPKATTSNSSTSSSFESSSVIESREASIQTQEVSPSPNKRQRRRAVIGTAKETTLDKAQIKSKILSPSSKAKGNLMELTNFSKEIALKTFGKDVVIPSQVPYEVNDLFKQLKDTQSELEEKSLSPISNVCVGVGSQYRFGPANKQEIFKNLISQIAKGVRTQGDIMAGLIEGEGIKPGDVEQIFRLMDLGLQFGVAVLVPTMPFCVQYEILKLLGKEEISFVFVSRSMSMGVNFPARTCVVRSLRNEPADIGEALQMKGRAGRRGHYKEKDAYSVTWNVSNAAEIKAENIPRLVLDRSRVDISTMSVLIQNHEKAAMDLSQVRLRSKQDALEKVDKALKISHEKESKGKTLEGGEVNSKKGDNNKGLMEEGEDDKKYDKKSKKLAAEEARKFGRDDDDEDCGRKNASDAQEEKKKIKKEDEDSEFSDEPFTEDPSVIVSVVDCASVIGKHLGMDEHTINDLTRRIQNICTGTENAEMLRDAYGWAEKVILIKMGIQEIHTALHKRECFELLRYLNTMHSLVHRIAMRYIGLAYQKTSKSLSE